MKRFWTTVFLALIVVGGSWILLNQDLIEQAGGLRPFLAKHSRSTQYRSTATRSDQYSAEPTGPFRSASTPRRIPTNTLPHQETVFGQQLGPARIRVASFKLSGTTSEQPDQALALGVVANICLKHDVIAFQEVDGHKPGWLDELTSEISRQSGGQALFRHASDHVRVARNDPRFAFVYNSATLELEVQQAYTVADPDNVLLREPLVGWFRTRLVHPNEAFTFTLANLQLDPEHPGNEIALLGNLYDAIRRDGRGEDDVIFVGDFKSGDRALNKTRQRYGMTWVVSDQATNTMQDAQFDNIVFNQIATLEFTGNGGVIDFLKAYNLGFRDAMSISDQMPVWAEFSASEKTH